MPKLELTLDLNRVQRKTVMVLGFLLVIVLPLLLLSGWRFASFVQEQKNIQEIELRVVTLERNPLLKKQFSNSWPELLPDLEKIKEQLENNSFVLAGSDVLENSAKEESFKLELEGNYLLFLKFLYGYCEARYPYRLQKLSIKRAKRLGFDLEFNLRRRT